MQPTLHFSPEMEGEIKSELGKGMFQTAIFLTIRHMSGAYDLSPTNYRQSYSLARSILHRQFPEYFPQMTFF